MSKKLTVPPKTGTIGASIRRNYQLYLLLIVPIAYALIFLYYPMLGAQIAFREYSPVDGIWGSTWVGLKHFRRFFNNAQCWTYIKNTVAISSYSLLLGIPFPVILALSLEYSRSKTLGKSVQFISYVPHFLSTVIIVGMINTLFSNRTGVVNNLLDAFFGFKVNFLGNSDYFRSLHVWSGIWSGTGWAAILYISALSSVDVQLHEAAIIDGASKIRRIWHIDLVAIRPTITTLLIINMGSIFSVGFDKIYLMQNTTNLGVSEVLSTYVYKTGIGGMIPNYSYAAAVGLITSVVNFFMVVVFNKLSNKISDSGLW